MTSLAEAPPPNHTIRGAFGPLIKLALPVVTVALGMRLMGIVDAIMVGRISSTALASVALGDFYFFSVTVFGMGTVMALDPLISQAVGAKDTEAITIGVQRGLVLALLLGGVSSLILIPATPIFRLLGQPAEVIPIAGSYVRATIAGTIPLILFYALRQILQAMGKVAPIVGVIVLSNLANVFLNWVFIYGNLGFPELGAVGSGWASSVSRTLLGLGLIALAWRELSPHLVPLRRRALALRPLQQMLAIGAPIGGHIQLEFGAFGVIALMTGWMGADQMAAHQIAITLASLTFMVPVGIAAAGTVLTGRAIGGRDMPAARASASAALIAGVSFMGISASLMLALPDFLAGVYTTDSAVLAFATSLIPIAGFFQVFDGVQVVAVGVLRGAGDTRVPMLIAILGFWILGLPVSVYLGFQRDLGPVGLWWGLVVGLAVVSVFLMARVRNRFARDIGRLQVDN